MKRFGKAFSDNIVIFKSRRSNWNLSKFSGWGARLTILYFLLMFCSLFLVVRLFHLTIVKGRENQQLAEGNRIKTFIIHAPRGIIYDRKGIPLVKNISGLRIENKCDGDKYCGKTFITDEDWKSKSKDNVVYEKDFLRVYLYPEVTASILGYITELTQEELNNSYYQYQTYYLGDHIGRTGIEAYLEKELRGVDGKELIEVDAANNRIRTLGKVEAIPGEDVYLTIDIDLQKQAFTAMADKAGAVVVSRPRSGEILTLVSTPSYDPNKIIAGIDSRDFDKLINDPIPRMFNRAISGVYPPGSIFKLIVAVAGIESGKFNLNTSVIDTGIIKINEFSFANWYFTQYGKTDGNVDLVKAIARSNDIYFYKIGEATGITEIAEWAKKFGLGKKTGIELSGEAEGLMPDATWRKKVRNEDWYLGDTYHIAIGQGDLQTTPVQVNLWTNAIASKGFLCKPTLIKAINQNKLSATCENLKIQSTTIDTIIQGMEQACAKNNIGGYDGTGYPFFDFQINKNEVQNASNTAQIKKVNVACKTGTAEIGDQNKTHAWFTVFAPLPENKSEEYITGDPELVATVLVEKGGEGSSVAAPIAKQILEEWFKR